ncbi:MAG TPA: type II toxin-antitoxin system RelE/ParE family toxin [Longimicrobium sp.]
MKVVWSDTALAQLRAIHAYIAQNSERYAQRTVDRLTNRTKQIAQFPRSGRVVPEFESEDIRELIEGHYRLIYEIQPRQIVIAAVVHTAASTRWL